MTELNREPDSSRQGQAQNSDFEFWGGYDSARVTNWISHYHSEMSLKCFTLTRWPTPCSSSHCLPGIPL